MYGNQNGSCDERTPFRPSSPYGTSKMAAHHLAAVYRQRGLFVVGGILFNHESPRRGAEMVTRKITRAAASWVRGGTAKLRLGNLQARRDWGFAGDYVKAMHAMLQRPDPKDYVIGSGQSHSVAEFLSRVLAEIGTLLPGVDTMSWAQERVEVDPLLLRTGEIPDLLANPSLARRELRWAPEVGFDARVRMMVLADVEAAGGKTAALAADGMSAWRRKAVEAAADGGNPA
jgi:GDPmannose 4,6-dehydratase